MPNSRTATSPAESTTTSNSPTAAGAPSIDVSVSDRGAASEDRPRVVIVGGGFGGIAAVNWLKRVPVQVTLIDRTNCHLFQPLLYQVAAGVLEPGTIAIPIRSMFRGQANIDIRMGEVIAIDKGRRCVQLNGETESIPYDYLILATGSHSTYFGHDDWAPFGYIDKGSMATIAMGYAILEKGKLKLSGPIGKLGWAFIHILYLGGAESQLLLCVQWLFSLLRGKTVSRYIDVPPSAPAERQLAHPARQPARS